MRLEIKGIKCDTRHCNYASWEVPFEDYPNWINKRCPVCGSNLLTQSEYDRCISMYKRVDTINAIDNVLKWINPVYYFYLIFGDKKKKTTLDLKTGKIT